MQYKAKKVVEIKETKQSWRQGHNSLTNSLVPAPIFAVTADKKFRACVNENTFARDPFLAVGHLGWGSCVNLVNAG